MDLSEATTIQCEKCESLFFDSVFMIKRVTKEQVGKDGIIPIPTFRCAKCGHINEEFSLSDEKLRDIKTIAPKQTQSVH